MNLFSTQAMASSTTASPQGGFVSFVPLIAIFFIFYFLLIRPQQKKFKLQKQMWEELKIGNKVITASGIFGKIVNIDRKENSLGLEIAENTIIKITIDSISNKIEDKKTPKKIPKKSNKGK